jgi:hypothetical protein
MGTDDDDIEVEQLLATGVIAPPRESKGKGKQVDGAATKGHVIFTDDKEERELNARWNEGQGTTANYVPLPSSVLTYERTPSVKTPVSRTVPEQQATTPQDFGWKDPSKKGKKAQQQAAYKPSEEAIERFEQRQAEREKALVKQAKVCRSLPPGMRVHHLPMVISMPSFTARDCSPN